MVQVRQFVRKTLDNPGARWLLSLRGTALVTLRTGRLCRVGYNGRRWVHKHADGVLVHKTMISNPPALFEALTRDICCFDYTPQPGDTVVDVGAGIGTQALTFSRMVGHDGRVLALEAHPESAASLARMVDLNGLENTTAVGVAASDRADTIRLSSNDTSPRGVSVPAERLDALLERYAIEKVDLLKMNIAGAELDALVGLGDRLRDVRHICVSCHDFKADGDEQDSRRTRSRVARLLRATGFVIRRRADDSRPYVRDYLYGVRY